MKDKCTVIHNEHGTTVVRDYINKYPIENTLGDVVITITVQRATDEGIPCPVTYVYRYDIETPNDENVKKFIKHLEESEFIVDGGQMKNE